MALGFKFTSVQFQSQGSFHVLQVSEVALNLGFSVLFGLFGAVYYTKFLSKSSRINLGFPSFKNAQLVYHSIHLTVDSTQDLSSPDGKGIKILNFEFCCETRILEVPKFNNYYITLTRDN